jgi:hypothetical protein
MNKKTVRFLLILALVFLVQCNSTARVAPVLETISTTPILEVATIVSTPKVVESNTATVVSTSVTTTTVTLDTRLPPEKWREWPVIPSVTNRVVEIYQQGLKMGNNSHAFSKIGDCQSVKAAFMGFFDLPGQYDLGSNQYLQETIDNFTGYFDTDGQAVRGSFSPASVLSPLWANPDVCGKNESPLECELRLTQPSIAFIIFEFWWDGRTPETYEKNMRQVIDIVIAHGAAPILATKADNMEGDHSINLVTARLAYEYNLPLWNFWLAVQPLPYHGLDPVRNDGFHLSVEGWNVRSFGGLKALDGIWRGVRDN